MAGFSLKSDETSLHLHVYTQLQWAAPSEKEAGGDFYLDKRVLYFVIIAVETLPLCPQDPQKSAKYEDSL